jgi:hypothetical protein
MKKNLYFFFLIFVFVKENKTSLECVSQIVKTTLDFFKIINDFNHFGFFFEKAQFLDNFENIQKTFKNCEGKLPLFLDIDECVKVFVNVSVDINNILIDVDQKNFDRAVLYTILEYPRLVMLTKECLNSKFLQKINLKLNLNDLAFSFFDI